MAVGGCRTGVACVFARGRLVCGGDIGVGEFLVCGGVGRTLSFSSPAVHVVAAGGWRVYAARTFGRTPSFLPPTPPYALPSLTVTLVLFLPSSLVAISLPSLTPRLRFSLPDVSFVI
ncbi:hypothetical protein C8R44DRAFT_892010 [Mycena epipterygia]|nr:hypothetical protein C8R44DRAFT_892010 [Mycena epipterygia]